MCECVCVCSEGAIVIAVRNKHGKRKTKLDEPVCNFHCANILGKIWNYYPSMGKIVGRTGLFNLCIATGLGEGKLWIQTCRTTQKIDLVSHFARTADLGKYVYICVHVCLYVYMRLCVICAVCVCVCVCEMLCSALTVVRTETRAGKSHSHRNQGFVTGMSRYFTHYMVSEWASEYLVKSPTLSCNLRTYQGNYEKLLFLSLFPLSLSLSIYIYIYIYISCCH